VIAVVRLDLGCAVHCSDAPFGELADVLIDPGSRRVSHLVVQPEGRPHLARLVTIEEVDLAGAAPGLRLAMTSAALTKHQAVHESAYLRMAEEPKPEPGWAVGIEESQALPSDLGMDGLGGVGPVDIDPHVMVVYDRVPEGLLEIRRASDVVSVDGHRVGHVDAFMIDDDGRLTHVVLVHGHLWGRRDVPVPFDAVREVRNDEIELSLTKDEVQALPQVRAR